MENPTATLSHQQIDNTAPELAALFKAMSHVGRLKILSHLVLGEKSVSALESLLDIRQTAVSQQLARLREDNLVRARREGKSIHYSIADEKVRKILVAARDIY